MRLADVEFSGDGRVVVARLAGELDPSNAEGVGAAILERVPNGADGLVLDLSAVEFLDSAAVRLIFRLRAQLVARGQALRLAVPPGTPARDALRLAGVAGTIEASDTVAEAVRSLG
jgi:anti-anti-sigma factor